MEEAKYFYSPRFNHFNIYERGEGSAKFIDSRATEEEARKEVYRLNGWKYKPRERDNESSRPGKRGSGF